MMRRLARRAFTLAEMMIAMGGSTVVIGALLFSSVELQKSLHASESYATYQADQRRLLDCLSRDIRRSIGLATSAAINGSGGTRLSRGTVAIEGTASLVITLPGYYQSNSVDDPNYDKPLDVVTVNNYADYGAGNEHAASVPVIFRKEYVVSEGSVCFVRHEGDAQTILIRQADNFHLTITLDADGRAGTVEVTFVSPRHGSETKIAMRDQVLLRNIRLD